MAWSIAAQNHVAATVGFEGAGMWFRKGSALTNFGETKISECGASIGLKRAGHRCTGEWSCE